MRNTEDAVLIIHDLKKEKEQLNKEVKNFKDKIRQMNIDYGFKLMDQSGTIWDKAKRLQDENERLKEACSMLREDRDTWKESYMWMKQGCCAASEIIEKLKAAKIEAYRNGLLEGDLDSEYIPGIMETYIEGLKMAELKPEDWEELDETINREKEIYTESDIKAARKEERERCIEIVENDCTNLADQHFIIKAIRKMGDE